MKSHVTRILFSLLLAMTAATAATAETGADSAVYVITDDFSSWIALPGTQTRYDVYAFAQADWYLRDEQGFFGALSTAVPGEGVVQRAHVSRLPDRGDEPSVYWTLPVSQARLDSLRMWLEGSYDPGRRYVYHDPDSPEDGTDSSERGWTVESVPPDTPSRHGWSYHPTHLDYSIWWNCHDYILHALQRVGLEDGGCLRIVIQAGNLCDILSDRYGDPRSVSGNPRPSP